MARTTAPWVLLPLLGGACRIELQLATTSGPAPVGSPWIDLPWVPPPEVPGACPSGPLALGQRVETHLLATTHPSPLHEWRIAAGRVADFRGVADDDGDLLYGLACGGRCRTDGWLELFTGEDPFLKEYEGVGVQLGTPGTGLAIATCDLDGDAVDEVIVADIDEDDTGELGSEGMVENTAGVYWHGDIARRVPTTVAPGRPTADFGLGFGCADTTGDGTNDLLVVSEDAVHVFVAGAAPRTVAPHAVSTLPSAGIVAASGAADANGDGQVDLAYTDRLGDLYLWDGAGAHWLAELGGEGIPVSAGDLDHDGCDELLVGVRAPDGTATLELRYGEPDAPWASPSRVVDLGPSALPPRIAVLSDLDDDGFAEIAVSVVGWDDDRAGRLALYPGTPSLGPDPSYTCTGLPGEELALGFANAGDLDGDGYDELVVSRRTSATAVFEIYTRSAGG